MFYRYRTNIIFTMREQVQQLISQGRTEEALTLLAKHNGDAVLLQARYNQAKKQKNMGMIDFGEWSRVLNQVNHAAIEMAGNIKISGNGNIYVSNISDSQIIINTRVQNNVKVTINFSSKEAFKDSISQLDLPTLISLATSEFKGKPAMIAWLPIKQEYDGYELLGTPFAPGYLTTVKKKLVAIYDEFWTKAQAAKSNLIKSAIQAIYDSLMKGKTKDVIADAIVNFQIFFHENIEFHGLGTMEILEEELNSKKMELYLKAGRTESYQAELDTIHSELVTISNRILTTLEQ